MRRLLFVLFLVCNSALAAPPKPAFELRALGVLGGDWDENLSSYLLGQPGQAPTLLIDGGSLMTGVTKVLEREKKLSPKATWSMRVRAALEYLKPVRALLLTHSHLDHVGGFLVSSTLDIALANGGRPPLEIVALPETIEAIHRVGLAPPLWADFTTIPAQNPALKLAPLSPDVVRDIGGFSVRAVPLAHPVPSAAFFVANQAGVYLHLGDTGPTSAVWEAARPIFRQGRLRALAIEVSFASKDEELAGKSGHLTPHSLVAELAKLVELPPDDPKKIAAALNGLPIVVLHIKAAAYDDVIAELKPLERAGFHLIVPEQGERYVF